MMNSKMLGMSISKKAANVYALLCVAFVLCLYTGLSHYQHIENAQDRTIPSWGQLWDGMIYLCEKQNSGADDEADLLAAALMGTGMESETHEDAKGFFTDRILWEASRVTLGRLFAGLSIGVIGGIIVGLFMGCFLKIDAALSPIMYFASRIIPTAAMPIFFKIAGIDFEMYVTMIAFGSMPIVTLTVSQYVQAFPDELRYKSYTLGASHMELITTAIVPYILPKVIDLIVLMIGPALVYLIAAEQVVAGEGFGYRIRVLTKATRFEVVYPLIVILTIYAGMLTMMLKWLQKKWCPWSLSSNRG